MIKKITLVINLYCFLILACKAQTPVLWGLGTTGTYTEPSALFKYNTLTQTETVPFTFNVTNGNTPNGGLIRATDSLLYGLTFAGGTNDSGNGGDGVLFSYDISSGTETVIHNFGSTDSDGKAPNGSLLEVGDSVLVGLTSKGGSNNGGSIFSYNIITGIYNRIYDFGQGDDGTVPLGTLIKAYDGLLYGAASEGGSGEDLGTIFRFNMSNNQFTVLRHLSFNTGGRISGSLLQATDTLLYGMAYYGGTQNLGVLFSYNIATYVLDSLHSFGVENDGETATGTLIQASNRLLYGTTTDGGTNASSGIIFSYDITSRVYTILHNFGSSFNDGGLPCSALVQASNGLLYGSTTEGGASLNGTIFSYDIASDSETVLYSFGNSDAAGPTGPLLEIDIPATNVSSIFEISDNVQISPNPSSGFFTINLTSARKDLAIKIYDIMGQKVQEKTTQTEQTIIDLSQQQPGVYLIEVATDSGLRTGKVILTR